MPDDTTVEKADNKLTTKLTMGLGWIPATDRYLEIVGEIERANDLPQSSVYSISEAGCGLQFTQVLPVCDEEQAILECVMNRWVSQLCRVCGAESSAENGFCRKHLINRSLLSPVKSIEKAGIPTTGKDGAVVAARLRGTGFFVAYHRYPERFLPPHETGSCFDQLSTEWEGILFSDEARRRILETLSRQDVDFIPMDVHSLDTLCGPAPASQTSNVIDLFKREPLRTTRDVDIIKSVITRGQVRRADALRGYWMRWSRLNPYRASEEQWQQALRWLDGITNNHQTLYITGFSALDYSAGRPVKPGDVSIASIHLLDTTFMLSSAGLYEDSSVFSELGVVLPAPLVANPERAVFDILHNSVVLGLKLSDLSLLSLHTVFDAQVVFDFIAGCRLPKLSRDRMLLALGAVLHD